MIFQIYGHLKFKPLLCCSPSLSLTKTENFLRLSSLNISIFYKEDNSKMWKEAAEEEEEICMQYLPVENEVMK